MNRRQKLVQQQFLNNEAAIIKRLKQVYGQALKDVNGNIEALMKRFDPETGDLPQSAIYQLQYQNMIKDQLEGILNQIQTKQFISISGYLDTCYEDGFVGSLFDLHGQGVPLMIPLNQEAMVTAVQLDSKISQGLYTRLGEDVGVLKKKITAQVSRSIATGTAFADCAKQLAGYTRIGYNNAIRIARTEGHRIQNQAAMNAMEQAKERGADVVKQWDATLDGKTRDSHAAVDGEIREIDEKFSNNLMFPGDPSGAAAEVINCRCRALQRARWAVGGGFTKWNNFTRQLETFDAPQDYGEFKKAFFSDGNKRYMNYVQDIEKKYKSRDWMKIMDRMTEKEYDRYFDLMSENPIYNGKVDFVDPEPDNPWGFPRISVAETIEESVVAVNPKYSTGRLWQVNCQRCVPTYEMRRRGYDVEALPRITSGTDPMDNGGWYKIFDGVTLDHSVAANRTHKVKQNVIDKMLQYGDGARAEVYVLWKGVQSSHVFVAENVGGIVRFMDPQTGNTDCSSYFSEIRPSYTYIIRMDGHEPTDLIKACCRPKGE